MLLSISLCIPTFSRIQPEHSHFRATGTSEELQETCRAQVNRPELLRLSSTPAQINLVQAILLHLGRAWINPVQ